MAKYRAFQRKSGVWYLQDRKSGEQESLRTRDKTEATRLLNAKNEAVYQPAAINLQLARAYISASDPKLGTRNWQEVMEQVVKLKRGETHRRWAVAIKDKNFDSIRKLPVLETRSDHFLKVLSDGKISTNVYLRRVHNFALNMDWLLRPVLPKPSWPKVSYKAKRGITIKEHLLIIGREQNAERRAFYQLCWHLGGSQTDIAHLDAEDVDCASHGYSSSSSSSPASATPMPASRRDFSFIAVVPGCWMRCRPCNTIRICRCSLRNLLRGARATLLGTALEL